MIYFARGSETEVITRPELKSVLFDTLDKIGSRRKVLAIPPDYTRSHSQSGPITRLLFEYYREKLTDILPALGTHAPMSGEEMDRMFGDLPRHLFRIHHWRQDLAILGEVPADFLYDISEGKVQFSWPVQVNKLLVEGGFDLILSVGQVVPHEVIGMANYNKNILVGTGGRENIHKSHFLGAVYGMERIMGKTDNPVRRLLNYAARNFLRELPIIYILTVIGRDDSGKLVVRGLYVGNDEMCFEQAAELSRRVNIQLVPKSLHKVVVYLDPLEFKSTWLGNKSIYRTRMAIADGGELIVLAPGVHTFGEDREIDTLIRRFGYRSTPEILDYVKNEPGLRENLAAAAHLIHGSSENRFTITCCPGRLSQAEIESVNFKYGELNAMMRQYSPEQLKDGYNLMSDGEEVYFISNPALGLWAVEGKFRN